jgi:hypothetical protein
VNIHSNGSTEKSEEKSRIETRLAGFDAKNSFVRLALQVRYGSRITHDELLSIAELVAGVVGIKVDRDAQRRKNVLLKWFEENWQIIYQILPFIVLEQPTNGD